MNYTKIFKRETKVIAYVVICLTLVVMGISYALFLQVNDNKANQVVTAGSLEITYDKGNVITVPDVESLEPNCLSPKDDSDGLSSGCEYELSIFNSGTLPMQYDLLIYRDDAIPEGGEHVPFEYIRHSLSKQKEEGIQPEVVTLEENRALSTLDTVNDTKKIIERSVIQPKETIVFTLKIWIDEDAPSEGAENIIGKYVYLKLDVSGLVYENEAATTTLLSSKDSGLTELNAGVSTFSENTTNKEYRYVGDNPNNYVYFNCSDATKTDTCEIWRILGIYNVGSGSNIESRIKLIKANHEELSAWDINGNKDYENSQVNSRLTVTYYDALSDIAKGQIDKAEYRLGGTSALNISGFEMLGYEYGSLKTISVPVGLMNVSDYVLASGLDEGVTLDTIASRNANNWLYTGKSEWFINQNEANEVYALEAGAIGTGVVTDEKLIRPVVYLDSNIKIIGGDGTSSNPYLLSK